jgi:hypothetical protein
MIPFVDCRPGYLTPSNECAGQVFKKLSLYFRPITENIFYLPVIKFIVMEKVSVPIRKASTFLLFPWGLFSIIIILVLNITLNNSWFGRNWSWIALILIIPAAILENFKIGYTTMQIMFLKVLYSLLSFLIVGMAFGAAIAGWQLERFQKITNIERIKLPWYVLLALLIMLFIDIAQLFSMLKAVKRSFMQFDPDN